MTHDLDGGGRAFVRTRKSDVLELVEGLENAARVAWTWLKDDESPWERHVTLRMVAGLSRMAEEVRQAAAAQPLPTLESDDE